MPLPLARVYQSAPPPPPSTCDPARGSHDTSRRQVGPHPRGVDRGACSLPLAIRGPAPAERTAEPVAGEVVLHVHPTQEAERHRQDVIGASSPRNCRTRPTPTNAASLDLPPTIQSPRPGAPGRRLDAAATQHMGVVQHRPPSTAAANGERWLTIPTTVHSSGQQQAAADEAFKVPEGSWSCNYCRRILCMIDDDHGLSTCQQLQILRTMVRR